MIDEPTYKRVSDQIKTLQKKDDGFFDDLKLDISEKISLFYRACEKGDLQVIDFLVDKIDLTSNDIALGIQYNIDYSNISDNNTDILKILVNHDCFDREDNTQLSKSIQNDDIVSFKLLLEAGINTTNDNNPPLFMAVLNNRQNMIDILFEYCYKETLLEQPNFAWLSNIVNTSNHISESTTLGYKYLLKKYESYHTQKLLEENISIENKKIKFKKM